MSEPKLISPMLDGFVMGDAISEHHGVRCCPAMVKETGSKYIVKIISVPASQIQLEALLLSGAYGSEGAALNYFKEQAQDIIEEADVLRKLSKLEGFLPFEGSKIVPMENEVGFDVYLLSPYRRSLENYIKKHTMTHLAAVNLGLDMCASLAVARQAGYLYIDLKPQNIYISADQEYRIGDLGFINMNSLKYASFPDKYRSTYTAPELKDAYAEINTTVDTYAAGMILYQAYNGGILPEVVAGEKLIAPAFADYEMAEIILKACDPDPCQRWEDPIQMGQALVAYMQRNGANNDPIVPAAVISPVFQEKEETTPANETEIPEAADETTAEADAQITIDGFDTQPEESSEDDSDDDMTVVAEPSDTTATEVSDADMCEDIPVPVEIQDDTLPTEENIGEISYDELTDDVSEMLSIADDLIEHEPPAPAVAPDPVEIPMPDPIVIAEPEEPTQEEVPEEQDSVPAEDAQHANDNNEDEDYYDEDDADDYDESYDESNSKTGKKILAFILALVLLAGLAYGAYIFYNNYYLQSVSHLTLEGDGNMLRVEVGSQIDDSLLTVVCTDIHGNQLRKPVTNGVAIFEDLNPNTLYNVKLEISGLRKLTGETSDSYTTPMQTTVLNFGAMTGNEAGTVMLSFNIDGTDSSSWTISYFADDEEIRTEEFTDHLVSLSGLTVGKEYTFVLDAVDTLLLTGQTQISHVVTAPVFAQNLAITGLGENSLSVSWQAPENSTTQKWIVTCTNDHGYEQTVTVSQTSATFEGIDPKVGYTIEVIAEGMSAGTRTYMSDNAVSLTDAKATASDASSITVSWNAPSVQSKWIVTFAIDGFEKKEVIRTSGNTVTLSPVIPGAAYTVTIQLEDGSTVFNGNLSVQVPKAERFEGKKLSFLALDVDMEFRMCHRPDKDDWTRKDVKSDDYTTTFNVGDKAAYVVYVPSSYNTSKTPFTILFVIRDDTGNLVDYGSIATTWREMWKNRYCELDIPVLPEKAGSYTMEVYFNAGTVYNGTFTMTAN